MAAAFFGYILPLTQVSFWGLTVISNVIASVPVVGQWLALWL